MSAPIDFLDVGESVDLTNCEREPIHIPGSIQPRGLLLAVDERDLVVRQCSENALQALGLDIDDIIDAPLKDVIGAGAAQQIARHVETFRELRERNPVSVTVTIAGVSESVDAVLHRVGPPAGEVGAALVIELEQARGPRPFSFPNTYQAVRSAVAKLNRAGSLEDLYGLAAREIRQLTGFDRVMVYRFDDAYNGVVVAEDKRADLTAFLGLHYPASDIPVQARRLYERNWIRLISDVDYTPSPLLPINAPPLDLSHAALRSVSPMHIEYLHNMGVHASMSISLMRHDQLWGLIACHHYAGPHTPPYGVRAAAEFLGSAISLRLVDRAETEDQEAALAARSTLATLILAVQDEEVPIGAALLGARALLDLIPADGVMVIAEGRSASLGELPPSAEREAVLHLIRNNFGDVFATDRLALALPGLALDFAGVLAARLPEDQHVIWFRREALHSVHWGGDPHDKVTDAGPGDAVRLSPRRSFERWTETVRGQSQPWASAELDNARRLHELLLEALYQRSRRRMTAAETIQRSLLPDKLPETLGWELAARYQPSVGGRVGGDWYDAITLPDGRLVIVIGDVAGHGLEAAGTMAQLRNALRAYLLVCEGPAAAINALDRLVDLTLSGQMATLIVAIVDTGDGSVELASAGHLPPCLLQSDGTVRELDISPGLPLGVALETLDTHRFLLEPGAGLVLFTDGVVERRTESLDDGLQRLRDIFTNADVMASLDLAMNSRDPSSNDDSTLLVLRRLP